jgi:hypothetical protein
MSVNRTTISGDRNVMKKEAENTLKYGEVTKEIQNLWNTKTEVIQLIIAATGSVSESFTKYLSNIPGKEDIKELQKTAILATAHNLESTDVTVRNTQHVKQHYVCHNL